MVQYYDDENIWKILSMMIGKMSQLKSELPKKSAENFMKATTKFFQNLTIILKGSTPHKVMEACTTFCSIYFWRGGSNTDLRSQAFQLITSILMHIMAIL